MLLYSSCLFVTLALTVLLRFRVVMPVSQSDTPRVLDQSLTDADRVVGTGMLLAQAEEQRPPKATHDTFSGTCTQLSLDEVHLRLQI
jgi:hypothetical protein